VLKENLVSLEKDLSEHLKINLEAGPSQINKEHLKNPEYGANMARIEEKVDKHNEMLEVALPVKIVFSRPWEPSSTF
jgi:hypothetical protein